MSRKAIFISFSILILALLFPRLAPLLLLFTLIFLDKVVFALLRFPGMIGMELATLNLILITLAFGYFPWVPLTVFIIHPIFDSIKMSFSGEGLPNLLGIAIDGSFWCLMPLFFLRLESLPFLISGLITAFLKNLIFTMKNKFLGKTPNFLAFVGNILFYYFLLSFAQEKILPFFGI